MIILVKKCIEVVHELPKVGLRGEFNLRVNRPDGTYRETGWFPNLILNAGLDRIGSINNGASVLTGCAIGTGNPVPAVTDTQLQALTAFTTGASSPGGSGPTQLGSPNYGAQTTFGFGFAQGAVVGNMAELGLGWGSNTLFCRALILDGGLNPTTLTVTAIDQLDVYYKVTMYPPLADTTGTITISGSNYNYTGRAALVNTSQWRFSNWGAGPVGGAGAWTGIGGWGYLYSSNATLGAITGQPSAAGNEFMNAFSGIGAAGFVGSYVPGTYYRDVQHSWTTANANLSGGVAGYMLYESMGGAYQAVWSPAIPKDNTKTMTLIRRVSWGRYP